MTRTTTKSVKKHFDDHVKILDQALKDDRLAEPVRQMIQWLGEWQQEPSRVFTAAFAQAGLSSQTLRGWRERNRITPRDARAVLEILRRDLGLSQQDIYNYVSTLGQDNGQVTVESASHRAPSRSGGVSITHDAPASSWVSRAPRREEPSGKEYRNAWEVEPAKKGDPAITVFAGLFRMAITQGRIPLETAIKDIPMFPQTP